MSLYWSIYLYSDEFALEATVLAYKYKVGIVGSAWFK